MEAERWRQISQLYHAAVLRPEPDRFRFVWEACGDDEALRQEVESLLAQSESAQNFMKTQAADLGATLMTAVHQASLIGRQVGAYRVLSLLGAGGMGEVYRARDTTLGRDVALKVLPAIFTGDRDRLARFEREARTLATLNHPHIGAIYGLEEHDDIRVLVLEIVEGSTLAHRLASGPLPLTEALGIARQIAEAIEAAHEKGIVHRDLKPANISITPDSIAKVLDFGLAKFLVGDGSALDLTASPTMTSEGTQEGMLVGTAAYMSPEQARGKAVDKRSDIWAFGCVLYEMLAGRGAFPGETLSDTIVAILEREPDWSVLPENTPQGIRQLLHRCLEKDPKARLRDIGEARIELEGKPHVSAVSAPRRRSTRALPIISVVVVVLLAAGAAVFYSRTPVAPVTSPSEYEQITNFTDSAAAPTLSADGRMVTFIRGGEAFLSRGQIYVKLLPNGESVRLTNDVAQKYAPVFTPDGSRIAYTSFTTSGTSLLWDTWTVPVLGGQPMRLLPNASGLTWITDRRILFSEIKGGALHMGIVTATESRAESREIYFPTQERAMAHYSYASPDRKSVLVVEMDQTHAFGQPCRLVPFDGSTAGRPIGPPATCTSAAWSPDGRWMYFGASVAGRSHLWRQRFPDGAPEQITFGPVDEEGIALAPDGRSLVTSIGTRRSTIWIHDTAGDRAISSEGYALAPRLSRDGTRVFYLSATDLVLSGVGWGPSSAELRSVDLGSGKTDRVLLGVSVTDYDISRDEKEVAFTAKDSAGESQIWLAALDRGTPPRQIARAGDQVSFGADGDLVFRSLGENNALVRIGKDGTGRARIATAPVLDKLSISPDGEWVTIFSPGAGENALPATLAVPTRGGAPKTICDAQNCGAAWSSDGRFFYVTHVAGYRSGSAVSPGKTLAIPVPAGKSLPDLPASGINSTADGAKLPGIQVIDQGSVSPGPDPSTYVFTKTDLQRNLFRIPLH